MTGPCRRCCAATVTRCTCCLGTPLTRAWCCRLGMMGAASCGMLRQARSCAGDERRWQSEQGVGVGVQDARTPGLQQLVKPASEEHCSSAVSCHTCTNSVAIQCVGWPRWSHVLCIAVPQTACAGSQVQTPCRLPAAPGLPQPSSWSRAASHQTAHPLLLPTWPASFPCMASARPRPCCWRLRTTSFSSGTMTVSCKTPQALLRTRTGTR